MSKSASFINSKNWRAEMTLPLSVVNAFILCIFWECKPSLKTAICNYRKAIIFQKQICHHIRKHGHKAQHFTDFGAGRK
jgi:hypothetical protein